MTTRRKLIGAAAVCLAVAGGTAGCGSGGEDSQSASSTAGAAGDLPQGSDDVAIDPAEFTTSIDNPYWPMAPGSRWVYNEVEDGVEQRVVVTVTDRTKVIDGVETRVVHDVVSTHGVAVEKTFDWYAQDSAGNIWYFGEDTTEYEHGRPASSAGSFEAGLDGAQPGVALPAEPTVGMAYREEYKQGEAEDEAIVISTDAQA